MNAHQKTLLKYFNRLAAAHRANLRWHAKHGTGVLCGARAYDFAIGGSG